MIICSEDALVVGEYRRGRMTDHDRDWHDDIAFIVLSETTEDEYRRYVSEVAPSAINPPFERPMKFYRISTD